MEKDEKVVSIDPRVPHVLLEGDPLRGFSVHGPFESLTALREWAEKYAKRDWWGAPLIKPRSS